VTEPFGYLLKPFEERELHTTIEVVLYKRAAAAEKAGLEERLRHARKMEAIGQLTGGVAHSLNNMLQGIIGNLDLAMMSATDELRHFLEDAVFDAERAARLVKQLTLFHRQERADHQPVELRDLVEEVADRCRQIFDRRVSVLVEPGAADLPPILGHPEQLHQLLINLCTNARDALEAVLGAGGRSPAIRIALRLINVASQPAERSAAPGRHVQLSVTDNGVGMDQETRDRMFEPFFTTKDASQPTGLGLATVYGIVQDHHGWTECESATDSGTTVSVFLPVAEEGSLAQGAAPVGEGSGISDQPALAGDLRGSETVLVIADVDRFRSVLDAMLERNGYHSVLARSAQDGVDLYRHQHQQVDLVVVGLSTPGMSVQEALAELREVDPEMRTLVLNGQSPYEPAWTGSATLAKPFNTAQFLQAVRRSLAR
jgi:signal transduction histidine kinase